MLLVRIKEKLRIQKKLYNNKNISMECIETDLEDKFIKNDF